MSSIQNFEITKSIEAVYFVQEFNMYSKIILDLRKYFKFLYTHILLYIYRWRHERYMKWGTICFGGDGVLYEREKVKLCLSLIISLCILQMNEHLYLY